MHATEPDLAADKKETAVTTCALDPEAALARRLTCLVAVLDLAEALVRELTEGDDWFQQLEDWQYDNVNHALHSAEPTVWHLEHLANQLRGPGLTDPEAADRLADRIHDSLPALLDAAV